MTTTSNEVLVRTGPGVVRGSAGDGVVRFLGIPYAAAPFGAHRFGEPAPVTPWEGVRDAVAYGATAPKGEYPEYARALLPEPVVPGEDCLNLNVWAPEGASGRPVMVWVHGGSFTNGSNAVAEYDGTAFARDGVVCVVINYRLGVEGFLRIEGAPDNRGLLDVLAALRWVQEEITAFGGDPARVTLAGESAGAMGIAALFAAPAAEGLFSAAVLQSGAAANVLTAEEADLTSRAVSDRVGRPATREALSDVPPERFPDVVLETTADLRAHPEKWGGVPLKLLAFAPHVDGTLIPRHPLEAGGPSVPVLIGRTSEEWRLFLPPAATADVDEARLLGTAAYLDLAAEGVAAYRRNVPGDTAGDTLARIFGDRMYLLPVLDLVDARPAGAPTWSYVFDAVARGDNAGLGSCHATDVPFVFDTLDEPGSHVRIGARPSRAAATAIHAAWVRFVTDHDPGWPAYEPRRRTVAVLAADGITAVDGLQDAQTAAWGRA